MYKGMFKEKKAFGQIRLGYAQHGFLLVATSNYVLSVGRLVFFKRESLHGNIGWSLWGRLSYFVCCDSLLVPYSFWVGFLVF